MGRWRSAEALWRNTDARSTGADSKLPKPGRPIGNEYRLKGTNFSPNGTSALVVSEPVAGPVPSRTVPPPLPPRGGFAGRRRLLLKSISAPPVGTTGLRGGGQRALSWVCL